MIVAAILALIIRTFVVQAFKIPSGSMEDTLLIGDHLLVNKFIYGTQIPFTDTRFLPIRHPERGDVIVFEFPEDEDKPYFDRRDFIKRVIGTPGDTVEVRDKKVYVNGEPYVIPQEVHKDPDLIPAKLQPPGFHGAGDRPAGQVLRHGRQPGPILRQPLLGIRGRIEDQGSGLYQILVLGREKTGPAGTASAGRSNNCTVSESQDAESKLFSIRCLTPVFLFPDFVLTSRQHP